MAALTQVKTPAPRGHLAIVVGSKSFHFLENYHFEHKPYRFALIQIKRLPI
jgi:hypothetical protein